ncbi:MAG: hypothetical protein J1E35_01855 [Lachnospiraceae bacterium]|nr:hypothetical protein [Lachnospiraceae bacterium]
MKILLLSRSNLKYDGRLRELLKVSNEIGDTICITAAEVNRTEGKKITIKDKGFFSYIRFILLSIKLSKKVNILFVDNRLACVPALAIWAIRKKILIIQDVRELYIKKEIKRIRGKIGCFFEEKLIKKADIILCANKERAAIMKKIYHLSSEPYAFLNMHMLEKNACDDEYAQKYEQLFPNNSKVLISTAGCDISRMTDKLVLAMREYKETAILLLVGKSNEEDINIINKLMRDNRINNVFILPQVAEGELKYLISKSDIGVVSYSQVDANNKYCASGKIYEFLYEGKPVVTTTNPPLKNMCVEFEIGYSDDAFVTAIKKTIDNIEELKYNVEKYFKPKEIENNNAMLIQHIKELLRRLDLDA